MSSQSGADALLRKTAALVERGWCQGALARDPGGHQVAPWSGSACYWSPLGALLAVWYADTVGSSAAFPVAYAALERATGGRVEEWNGASWRRIEHVLRALQRARGLLPPGDLAVPEDAATSPFEPIERLHAGSRISARVPSPTREVTSMLPPAASMRKR